MAIFDRKVTYRRTNDMVVPDSEVFSPVIDMYRIAALNADGRRKAAGRVFLMCHRESHAVKSDDKLNGNGIEYRLAYHLEVNIAD